MANPLERIIEFVEFTNNFIWQLEREIQQYDGHPNNAIFRYDKNRNLDYFSYSEIITNVDIMANINSSQFYLKDLKKVEINLINIYQEFKKFTSVYFDIKTNVEKEELDKNYYEISEARNVFDEKNSDLKFLLNCTRRLIKEMTSIIEFFAIKTLPNMISSKIKWNGSPSLLGYLLREFVKKGYIDTPLYAGEASFTGLAKQAWEYFEINTTKENLIREMNENKNSLSETKRAKFTIPELTDLK